MTHFARLPPLAALALLLLTAAAQAVITKLTPLAEVLAYATSRGYPAVAEPDFDRALRLGEREGATTLVTGSFHTVGDAMARLQVSPLTG